MELIGKIIVVQEAKSGTSSKTGNKWMKQEYVMEVSGDYTRHCAFTVFGEDRIKQMNIQNGEDVTIQFDIDAHEYNGRWYNEIRAHNVIRGLVNGFTVNPQRTEGDLLKNSDDSELPF